MLLKFVFVLLLSLSWLDSGGECVFCALLFALPRVGMPEAGCLRAHFRSPALKGHVFNFASAEILERLFPKLLSNV